MNQLCSSVQTGKKGNESLQYTILHVRRKCYNVIAASFGVRAELNKKQHFPKHELLEVALSLSVPSVRHPLPPFAVLTFVV